MLVQDDMLKDLIVVVWEPNAVIVVVDFTTDVEVAASEKISSRNPEQLIVDLTTLITTLALTKLDKLCFHAPFIVCFYHVNTKCYKS